MSIDELVAAMTQGRLAVVSRVDVEHEKVQQRDGEGQVCYTVTSLSQIIITIDVSDHGGV